ncbi:MAG: DUF5677 domain-containing protein [Promethearchaeota archaeon]
MTSSINQLYKACEESIELAEQILQDCHSKEKKVLSPYRGVVSFYFRRSWEILESFVILIKNNRLVDATLLLRSFCNMFIDLVYISAEPATKELKLLKYMLERDRNQLKLINTNLDDLKKLDSDIGLRKDKLEKNIKEVEEELKSKYPKEKSWELPCIADRAYKAGKTPFMLYNMAYRPYSNVEHNNVLFGENYVDEDKCEPKSSPEQGIEKSPFFQPKVTLQLLSQLFLEILKKFNEEFQLDYEGKIVEMMEKVKASVKDKE